MRFHSLIGLGLLAALAGCGDGGTSPITAPDAGPLRNLNPIITVSGETHEQSGPPISLTLASYAGGEIDVHYVDSGNNATYVATISGDGVDYDSFQAPTGSRIRLTAVPYTSNNCIFTAWGFSGYMVTNATIYAEDHPTHDMFTAFFKCYV
jgi:hypothetical protein